MKYDAATQHRTTADNYGCHVFTKSTDIPNEKNRFHEYNKIVTNNYE